MHWRHTFQTRIAGVLALLLLVVVAATYFAVKAATTRAVENQADVQLNTGRQVFERLLDLRGRRLQSGLDWLTADGPFKQAVAGGRTVPILEALGTHGTGVSSSEVFVLGLDDRVMVSTLLPAKKRVTSVGSFVWSTLCPCWLYLVSLESSFRHQSG